MFCPPSEFLAPGFHPRRAKYIHIAIGMGLCLFCALEHIVKQALLEPSGARRSNGKHTYDAKFRRPCKFDCTGLLHIGVIRAAPG